MTPTAETFISLRPTVERDKNEHNLTRWRARSAWLDHNSLLGVLQDPRTDEQRVAWEDRSELRAVNDFFIRRWFFCGKAENEETVAGRPDPKNWTGRFYVVAEIEAEYGYDNARIIA